MEVIAAEIIGRMEERAGAGGAYVIVQINSESLQSL